MFKTIMSMETFSLLDDGHQAGMQRDLSLYEIYNTRLVRLDQGSRVPQDPLQRRIHRCLRRFRYWQLSRRQNNSCTTSKDGENSILFRDGDKWKYQNTTLAADVLGRLLVTVVTGVFLIVPLAILSNQSSKRVQIAVIGVSIVLFASLVSSLLRASNVEMMVVAVALAMPKRPSPSLSLMLSFVLHPAFRKTWPEEETPSRQISLISFIRFGLVKGLFSDAVELDKCN